MLQDRCQEVPGKEGPLPIRWGYTHTHTHTHTHTISQRKKTQATAKLQIYWSGNKYKYLIKKLLWKALYTTFFPVWIQPLLP